jgi:hypothetical protein
MIKAMGKSNHAKLIELIRRHLPASPEEYIRMYKIRYGTTKHDREAVSLSP